MEVKAHPSRRTEQRMDEGGSAPRGLVSSCVLEGTQVFQSCVKLYYPEPEITSQP